jgi:hypothetical protein
MMCKTMLNPFRELEFKGKQMQLFSEQNEEQINTIKTLMESYGPIPAEFNVGLYVGNATDPGNEHGDQQRRYNDALRILTQYGTEVHDRFVNAKSSDDEPTLVAKGIFEGQDGAVKCGEEIAKKLNQIAVAIWFPTLNKGVLAGERASEWGDFNPEFFKRF